MTHHPPPGESPDGNHPGPPPPGGPSPDGPPDGPEQPQQPRPWGRILGVGCVVAVLLALFVAGCVVVLISIGDDAIEPGIEYTPEGPMPTGATSGAIGDPVVSGHLRMTVTGVQTGVMSVGSDPLRKDAEGQYVIVNVSVKNLGKSPTKFEGPGQVLIGDDGERYANDPQAEIYLGNRDKFFQRIQPGESVDGRLVYDIPADVRPDYLEMKDLLSPDPPVRVDLTS
ncbi:hypothetical protein GCM10009799_13650 [Nocardiopsis rhodophaea]|uniref:DUF4352 domain-containing protein n=1 Tax=Nocardiopsis rhodophaea TaxID=280238 RepID=A0ABN2SMM1_9ACTN